MYLLCKILVRFDVDELNRKIKLVQKTISDHIKAGDRMAAEGPLSEKSRLEMEKKGVEVQMDERLSHLGKLLDSVGNIVHDSVPVSNDEVWIFLFLFFRQIMGSNVPGMDLKLMLNPRLKALIYYHTIKF